MGVLGGRLGYYFLRCAYPPAEQRGDTEVYPDTHSKLETLLGPSIWEAIAGKTVIDFGCGEGREAIEIARSGASRVIGLDNRESILNLARRRLGGIENCVFVTSTNEQADVILSLNAFEHFDHPEAVLLEMHRLLKPGGIVLMSFGPIWLHPYGGHLFSVFPWAHVLMTERSLIRWRSEFKADGAMRFCEVEGGLNQMTIAKFERFIKASPWQRARLEYVPIRKLRWLHNRVTREFFTSSIRCALSKESSARPVRSDLRPNPTLP